MYIHAKWMIRESPFWYDINMKNEKDLLSGRSFFMVVKGTYRIVIGAIGCIVQEYIRTGCLLELL